MKTLRNILAITMMVAFLIACKNDAKPEVKTVETETTEVKALNPDATYAKAEFTVEGMTCAIGCAATIEKKSRLRENCPPSQSWPRGQEEANIIRAERPTTDSDLRQVTRGPGANWRV